MSTIVLVTGANRGIGFAIVQLLAARIPTAVILLGCRSTTAGHEAVEKLKALDTKSALDVVQIDIEDDSSIVAAVAAVEQKYGRLDGERHPKLLRG
jgi:NAD(P)-dependent dehydrogenase (short-subunit alcohol dehydrogenase family)